MYNKGLSSISENKTINKNKMLYFDLWYNYELHFSCSALWVMHCLCEKGKWLLMRDCVVWDT